MLASLVRPGSSAVAVALRSAQLPLAVFSSLCAPRQAPRAAPASAAAAAVAAPPPAACISSAALCAPRQVRSAGIAAGAGACAVAGAGARAGISTKRRRNAAMNRHKLQKLRKRMRKLMAKNVKQS